MKERILTNWTLVRVVYLFMGLVVMIQSIWTQQWIGVAFGAYFASMGLFAFGCASGNCFGGACDTKQPQKMNPTVKNVDYDEVKIKLK